MTENSKIHVTVYDKYINIVDWLKESNLPIAITLTEILNSSEGEKALIFPPTYANDKKDAIPYQIDELPGKAEKNTCLIDSVGSQANRMESCFKNKILDTLVPQIEVLFEIKENNEKKMKAVNLLDIGHRIADGSIRFSELEKDAHNAILALRDEANAELLAKLAPTSLIFGFWDSRPDTTMYKFSRILSSTIRATNVVPIKRSAQFIPAGNLTPEDYMDITNEIEQPVETATEQQPEEKKTKEKDPYSQIGLRAAPATGHGGIYVYGEIVRRTQINLVGLRALGITKKIKDSLDIDKEATIILRRYLLGLALVAGTYQQNYKLREGCLLQCSNKEASLIYHDGRSEKFNWDCGEVLQYAHLTAKEFGVGKNKQVLFNPKKVQEKVKQITKDKADSKKTKKGK
ncbi:MAG: type I-U CRISPR-associated RAMP protein Csb1/Cas7u [Planctomycetota bacterium]